jgi:protein-tyrosine phosphatase
MPLLNFRDVADASPRGPLKPGRLFRSGQPFHLDDEDLERIDAAGVATVIDLREPHEQVPPDWAPAEALGVRVLRVPVADQILPSVEEKEPPAAPLVQPESVLEGHRILGAFYRAIVDRSGVRLAEVMEAVADGTPVLVHCAAGKDRTGTTVALLLDLIGTPTELIVADFVRTNETLDDIMMQLTGHTVAQMGARVDMPPGIAEAPEPAIRDMLRHLQAQGGAAAVLRRHTSQAVLDRVVSALTS